MKHVADLLADLDLPALDRPRPAGTSPSPPPRAEGGTAAAPWRPREPDWLHELGAGLPAGHLHLWAGPEGAGKTSLLLALLYGAALHGRRVVYATYHLPAQSLALRLLAMTASVDADALVGGPLADRQVQGVREARAFLATLPIHLLEARGFGVASLEDRLARMPFRADVLAVDYLQAVVRSPRDDMGATVRAFVALSTRLHLAGLLALRSAEAAPFADVFPLADRAGWIAPAGGSGLRRAEVLRNRYGERPAVSLCLERASDVFSQSAGSPGPPLTRGV